MLCRCLSDSKECSGLATLGLAEKPVLATRYRHMLREDLAIWRKFIVNGKFLPDKVWYDVRVGNAVTLGDDEPEWMVRMNQQLTRKRIDVVGKVGLDFWVIELKPEAGYDAFGQVVYYAYDFQREYAKGASVVPVIVTDFADPDVLPVCSQAGVLVLEVGDPLEE